MITECIFSLSASLHHEPCWKVFYFSISCSGFLFHCFDRENSQSKSFMKCKCVLGALELPLCVYLEGWWIQAKYLMHRIHAVLRVITLSLGLHAMGYIRCTRPRAGSHHIVNRAWWWVWSWAGAHNGPWGQTCPRRRTRMGHTTCCVWRGGHLPNWWEGSPHSLRNKWHDKII